MLNIMRADLYRLLRGKSIYLAFALLLLGIAAGSLLSDYPPPVVLTMNFALLAPFVLVIIHAVCAPDFDQGTIKNSIAYGSSRLSLWAARLLLCLLLSELLYLLGVAVNYLVEPLAPASAQMLAAYDLSPQQVALGLAAQSFMLAAMVSCGVAIAHIARRGAVLIGAFCGLFFMVTLLLNLLAMTGAASLASLDFIGCTANLGFAALLLPADLTRCLLVGVVYLLVSLLAALALFGRSELR